jgi:hypothetical protein
MSTLPNAAASASRGARLDARAPCGCSSDEGVCCRSGGRVCVAVGVAAAFGADELVPVCNQGRRCTRGGCCCAARDAGRLPCAEDRPDSDDSAPSPRSAPLLSAPPRPRTPPPRELSDAAVCAAAATSAAVRPGVRGAGPAPDLAGRWAPAEPLLDSALTLPRDGPRSAQLPMLPAEPTASTRQNASPAAEDDARDASAARPSIWGAACAASGAAAQLAELRALLFPAARLPLPLPLPRAPAAGAACVGCVRDPAARAGGCCCSLGGAVPPSRRRGGGAAARV